LVPIIPEKNGNKTNALFVNGNIYTSQAAPNATGGTGAVYDAFYTRPGLTGFNGTVSGGDFRAYDLVANKLQGFMLTAQYFVTDQFSLTGLYWQNWVVRSDAYKTANPDGMKGSSQWVFAPAYDVNPAIRFAFNYAHTKINFNGPKTGYKNYGTMNSYTLNAMYFF
jgi:hypothetical protein